MYSRQNRQTLSSYHVFAIVRSYWRLASLFPLLIVIGCDIDRSPDGKAVLEDSELPTSARGLPRPDAFESVNSESQVARDSQPTDWFEDMTEQSGVRFTYRNGREAGLFTIVETVGGGVAMIDYDQDGDLDLFFPGGGRISGQPLRFEGAPSALYRNEGRWRFVDVTKESGLHNSIDYSLGCSVEDYDRDGYPDLLITCYGTSRLYHNNRSGGFDDVTALSQLSLDGFFTASAWADVNRDGWPDLYVTGYVQSKEEEDKDCVEAIREIRDTCGPWHFPPEPDRLFLNQRDGTFSDISESMALSDKGKGLGVIAADFDQNGWIDFYVANDTTPNQLYLRRPNEPFDEVGLVAGVAVGPGGTPEGSMGVDTGDFDGDGRSDIFVTNFEVEDNALYRGINDREFANFTLRANLGNTCRRYVGFGTGLVDFDLDGWLDVFVINGSVHYLTGRTSYLQPSFVFRNVAGQFQDVSENSAPYFSVKHAGRGAAVGDLDNDGGLDLVIVHQNSPVTLLRNRLDRQRWLRVALRGSDSRLPPIGATATIQHKGRTLVRHLRSGSGYLSHFDQRILFPVEDDQPQEIRVRWPTGVIEVFANVPVRKTTELVEGTGRRES